MHRGISLVLLLILLAGCAGEEGSQESVGQGAVVADVPAKAVDARAGGSDKAESGLTQLCDSELPSEMLKKVGLATDSYGETQAIHVSQIEDDLMGLHDLAVDTAADEVAATIVDAVAALDNPGFDALHWLQHPLDVARSISNTCLGTPEEREAEQQQQRQEFLEGARD